MTPPALIFDLDGTLIDSVPDIHAASNEVLVENGFAPLTLMQVRSFIGRGVPHLVHCLLEASGAGGDELLQARLTADFIARYEGAVGLTALFPGVREALAGFRDLGHPLAICTNKPLAPTAAVLRHFEIAPLFATIIGGDSLPARKPDPAPLLKAHQMLGGGRALYVGDSEVDAETAERAGLPFLLFTEGYRKAPVSALPHAIAFSDFAMLPGIVAHWPWEADLASP